MLHSPDLYDVRQVQGKNLVRRSERVLERQQEQGLQKQLLIRSKKIIISIIFFRELKLLD